MSHFSNLFNKVPVKIQNRSGFDMSHSRYFTATCGTLTPCLCAEVLPGDDISLGAFASVKLPPFASDFVGRIDAHFEYFFVPNRIVYGGWQRLMTHNLDLEPTVTDPTPSIVPCVTMSDLNSALSSYSDERGPGSLLDYLGYRLDWAELGVAGRNVNMLPLLAYHKIWDDWYRDSRIQTPCFRTFEDWMTSDTSWANIPFENRLDPIPIDDWGLSLYNGYHITSLHQRNFMKDYFTNASLRPQSADAASLKFEVSGGEGSFTIAELRAANSLQMFMERNNIAGFKYADQIRAQYGVTPSDAALKKAIYLGRVVVPVYNTAVVQTATSESSSSKSEFATVGASYGRGQAIGDGSVFDSFKPTEHGFLIGIFSLVPHAVYSTSTQRFFFERIYAEDYPYPILAGVGDQPVYGYECSSNVDSHWRDEFGYTQRFAEMKYIDDSVHGLLRDGGDLSYMVMQRSFDTKPTLGSQFIEIPKDYLDGVFAASEAASGYSCWVNLYHKLHMSRVLPAYSIPTLSEPKDTHTEMIELGGTRL